MSPSWTSGEHGGCSHPWFVFLENSLQWDSDAGTDFTYQQSGFPELSAHESGWGMGFLPGARVGSRAQGIAVSLMSAVDPAEPQNLDGQPSFPHGLCPRNARL